MSEAILEMRNVEKHFGGVRAIDDFSLKLEPGIIYGLIGPKGRKSLRYSLTELQNWGLPEPSRTSVCLEICR